jgi:proline iminopeptidase
MLKRPVCFALHGGPGGDHSAYVPALDPLLDYLQIVYIDYRGNGRSDYPEEDTYTIEQNVKDLEALRIYLGLNRIILLGQSYGGFVALSYATSYPENLAGLILLSTAPSHKFLSRAKDELQSRGSPEQIKMANYLWSGTFPDNDKLMQYNLLFSNLYAQTPTSATAFEQGISRVIPSYKALNKAFGEDLKSFDVIDSLHKISCPTLLIGGRYDWITPIKCTLEISERIANCQTFIMEESGHAVLKDQYEEVIAIVKDYLGQDLPV